MQHLIGEEKERTVGGAVLSLFLLVTKRLYGKDGKWSRGQIKTCRKKQHVRVDDMKARSDLICGKAAVGGNYNSTRDTGMLTPKRSLPEPIIRNTAMKELRFTI